MSEDNVDDAVLLLASVTGWQPDTIEGLSTHRFLRYFHAAKRKQLITTGTDG